ncbi:MAG: hypothetical protein BWY29_00995 [Microgenomates group bacterium ADurb.Bin238]|jgi:hypothetical protein|nr:MAG: hypothetical protein BWY29_00995 [Microgenomates group bacterium ADurb.Bin238]
MAPAAPLTVLVPLDATPPKLALGMVNWVGTAFVFPASALSASASINSITLKLSTL